MRLLTAGGESGTFQQCDYTGTSDPAIGIVDYADSTVPEPGTCSKFGYRAGTPAGSTGEFQFKHATVSEAFYRHRFYIDAATIGENIRWMIVTDPVPIERYHDGNENSDLSLEITANGAIEAYRDHRNAGAGTLFATSADGVVQPTTWHLCQVWFKMANSGGRLVVKIDGTTVIDFTGDTQGSQNTSGTFSILALRGSFNKELVIDDIAINDPTGTFNNSYPEDAGVIGLWTIAMGSGSNTLTGTPDATDRWKNIDERPPSDSDYNNDDVVGDYDLYELTNPNGTPFAAEIWARTIYPSTASTFKLVHKYDGVEYRSAALAPTVFTAFPPPSGIDGPWFRHIPLNEIPGTSNPWTIAALAELEIGFEVATAQQMRVTQLFLEVEGEDLCPQAGWGWSPGPARWHLI
jgi:hypothetical protein